MPKGEVSSGFHPFTLETQTINYQSVDRDLLIQHLRTQQHDVLRATGSIEHEARLEDYIVRALTDFNDISYDDHADLLYDLAGQMIRHLLGYLSADETSNVLRYYQKPLAAFIHTQMQAHHWENVTGYDVTISKGFTDLKPRAFTAVAGRTQDFRQTVADRSKIDQIVFTGFKRGLFALAKFQSDSERKFAIVLETDASVERWFRPALGQFQLFYKSGNDHREYQPDFVVETSERTYMCEPKARNDMQDSEVMTKKAAAVEWCRHASVHAQGYGGKPWSYLLIPHDAIAENMTLAGLASRFGCN